MSLSSRKLTQSLELFEFVPGKKASIGTLQKFLPDTETALFFAKAYKMTYTNLSALLRKLFQSSVLDALMAGDHSTELQDYIVDTVPENVYVQGKRPGFKPDVPVGEFLPELWKSLEVTVAKSISEVAEKLGGVLESMPSNQGTMLFQHLNRVNKQRPTIGTYAAGIQHARQGKNLVILDVSGSMSEDTVTQIADDVVALSYSANASMAIVSNTCFAWEPGSYDTADILSAAEYGGTQYEKLVSLLNEDWDTVVTIADYDSSRGAKEAIAKCTGSVVKVIDISLVDRPTFLAECVGQLADSVEPILIGRERYL